MSQQARSREETKQKLADQRNSPKEVIERKMTESSNMKQTPSHIDLEEERYMIDTRGMITSFHLILSTLKPQEHTHTCLREDEYTDSQEAIEEDTEGTQLCLSNHSQPLKPEAKTDSKASFD